MKGHFVSCDWGTSSFRLRLIDASDRKILAQTDLGKGIAAVYHEWQQANLPADKRAPFFCNILQGYLNEWEGADIEGLPLVISGMASSSIGIQEIPYGNLPFEISVPALRTQRLGTGFGFPHEIVLVSGLKTVVDVMRGEETLLLGCVIKEDDQLFIFPGTHSKHVQVQNRIATDIRTYMTGEFFDLLSNKSILATSVLKNDDDNLLAYFERGVRDATGNHLLNAVFQVRTNQLFNKLTPEQNYQYLSGLLIGAELNDLAETKSSVHFVCGKTLMKSYKLAAQTLYPGNNFQYTDADDALVNAHCQIWSYLKK